MPMPYTFADIQISLNSFPICTLSTISHRPPCVQISYCFPPPYISRSNTPQLSPLSPFLVMLFSNLRIQSLPILPSTMHFFTPLTVAKQPSTAPGSAPPYMACQHLTSSSSQPLNAAATASALNRGSVSRRTLTCHRFIRLSTRLYMIGFCNGGRLGRLVRSVESAVNMLYVYSMGSASLWHCRHVVRIWGCSGCGSCGRWSRRARIRDLGCFIVGMTSR